MVWSVESLPSNPAQHASSIPDEARNFKIYSRIGRVPFVFCPILSPAVALTLYSPHISGEVTMLAQNHG